MPTPLLCNPKPFKEQFRRDTTERKERRYCFILGAGASVSSGIPTGKNLAEQWLHEIYERQCPASHQGGSRPSLQEWYEAADCPVKGVDPKHPGLHYPQLFLARYPGHDPEGQRFIQEAVRGTNAELPNVPSVGYAYLSLLLQNPASRVVITTNFDNLAADALLLFTGNLPRVVGHEGVARFASLNDGQPLIAKIHGDVGFVTTNDPDGMSKLHQDWIGPLRDILRNHIPIFIGYDGNDGSLMDFFCENLVDEVGGKRQSLLGSGVYWCYRAGEGKDWKSRVTENSRLRRLTEVHQVHFVPIGDFDLWLMELGIACEVGDPEEVLRVNMERRAKSLAEQISRARGELAPPAPTPEVEASRAEAREEIGSKLKHWWLAYMAHAEKDERKAGDLYRQAIALAPDNPAILGDYATFLAKRRDNDSQAEELYERALLADPNHAINLGNYAAFLATRRRNYDKAQGLFERAVKANPQQGANLCNYANFCMEIRKDYERAHELYERALQADPSRPQTLGSYANFLTNIRRDHDAAQRLYDESLKADPQNAVNVGSYAVFMARVRRDFDEAQALFERAIFIDRKNVDNLGNYARFLAEDREQHDEAQALFEQALKIDPNHANNVSNYAAFLAVVRKDYGSAQKLYDRALAITPQSVAVLVNYANFLRLTCKESQEARKYFERALLDEPDNANSLGSYAGFLLAEGLQAEGLQILSRALRSSDADWPPGLDVELWFYAFVHGPEAEQAQALSTLKELVAGRGHRSPGWDFSANVARAMQDHHPESAWLQALAQVLNAEADVSTLDAWEAWKRA